MHQNKKVRDMSIYIEKKNQILHVKDNVKDRLYI